MAKSVVSELLNIFRVSYAAVLPEELVCKAVSYNIISQQLTIVNDNYDLKNKNVYVVGTGKAVQYMAKKLEDILISKIKGGIISIPAGSLNYTKETLLRYCEGAENNLPDRNAENTAKDIKNLVTELGNDDFLIVLISGGGSALLPLSRAPVTLEEKTELIKRLANAGADIKELNIVRTKLSNLKGGQLAMYAQPAQVVSLILSDIVGDPLDLIASGPTTYTSSKSSEITHILYKYSLLGSLPKSIEQILQTDEVNDKPFPSIQIQNYIIGSNKLSITVASNEAKKSGYKPIRISHTITGNIADIARKYSKMTHAFCDWLKDKTTINDVKSILKTILQLPVNYDFELDINEQDNLEGVCLILGGETTVLVKGDGKGGRNQQLALEFSIWLDQEKQYFKDFAIYFLSAGTDGIDGPTDAAGAIGYLDLVSDAINDNIDVNIYTNKNDSYNFYKKFRNGRYHVVTGHTGTNVMDIHLILIKNKSCFNDASANN